MSVIWPGSKLILFYWQLHTKKRWLVIQEWKALLALSISSKMHFLKWESVCSLICLK